MAVNDMKYITINKNRGWRGLSEVAILDEDEILTTKHIFSFSQELWDYMILYHIIVIKSEKYYYVIHFTGECLRGMLPRSDQQRSVLIKNFKSVIDKVEKVPIDKWSSTNGYTYSAIRHFRNNRNNHTTSDWNCIGLRVLPEI